MADHNARRLPVIRERYGCLGQQCDRTGDPTGCTAHYCYSSRLATTTETSHPQPRKRATSR